MQYKHYYTDVEWLPKEGRGIWLWKEDNDGKPILVTREPNALPPQQMQNHPEIMKGIGGFINFWKSLSAEDNTREYWRSTSYTTGKE
jgi:hypothetical protein